MLVYLKYCFLGLAFPPGIIQVIIDLDLIQPLQNPLLFNSCHEIDCHIKLSNQLLSWVFNVLRINYQGALDYYQAFCVCVLKTIYASSESWTL